MLDANDIERVSSTPALRFSDKPSCGHAVYEMPKDASQVLRVWTCEKCGKIMLIIVKGDQDAESA